MVILLMEVIMKLNKLILSTLLTGLIIFNAQNAIAEFPGQELFQNCKDVAFESVTDPKFYGVVAVGFIACYAAYKKMQSYFHGYGKSAESLLDALEKTKKEQECDQDREEILQARAKETGVKEVKPLVEDFCKKMNGDGKIVETPEDIIKAIRRLLFSWGW